MKEKKCIEFENLNKGNGVLHKRKLKPAKKCYETEKIHIVIELKGYLYYKIIFWDKVALDV